MLSFSSHQWRRYRRSGWACVVLLMLISVDSVSAQTPAVAAPASCSGTGECLCDTSYENCRDALIQLIRNEPVGGGIDVSFWFMTDWRFSGEIIKRWQAGVPVRVILDTSADVNYAAARQIRTDLTNAGIPIRDCVSSLGINHWKAMIFASQGKVQFSAANFADGSLSPSPLDASYLKYVDEAIYFTDDTAIVESFMRKFDDHWTDTSGAFVNLANISGTPTRKYPLYDVSADLNFVPYQNFETRLRTQVLNENQQIDAVMFRITSATIPDALINRQNAGVPVRLITDVEQYRNTKYFWHSYNVDRMYKAGISIKIKDRSVTEQSMHQKSILLYGRGLVVFGSSNWTSSSASRQREHNYFSPKGWMLTWFQKEFERKWNNLRADNITPVGATVFDPFVPKKPETPVNVSPANDALGQGTLASDGSRTVTLKWEGGWWAHKYDIYLSTTSTFGAPIVVDYVTSASTAGVKSTKESYSLTGLQPGTTYYWKVHGKTMADMEQNGPVWRFTTAGDVAAPPAPTGLTATAVSSTRIDLAWTDVAGEEGYKVERKLSSATTWTQIATTGAGVVTYADTSGLSPGAAYNYRVRAYTSGGNSSYSNTVTVTTPSVALSSSDVVLYARRATIVTDNSTKKWSIVADSTAAGGQRISNSNLGAATITTPLANPVNYFEMQFTASAGKAYRLWMRGKATSNSGYSDSVWVQFAGAVNASGKAINIGTTSAEWVNLQDCSGCTLNGWAWQDNGYGGFGPLIYFNASGTQTIRVQVREDGPSFDQIVLSPDTYLNASPGATKLDTVILPEQGGTAQTAMSPSDVVLHTAGADISGTKWSAVSDSTAAGGGRVATSNLAAATIATPSASPSDYFEMQFTAIANEAYRLWMRGKAASDNGYNDSVWVQFSSAVNENGKAINIGTTNAEWVNLQDCPGCTLEGWAWQDNGYGGFGPLIYFDAPGVQTVRVQVREDGASFDQIVLSRDTFLNQSPGLTKRDTTILPAQNGSL